MVETLKKCAEWYYGEAGAWAYDAFTELNADFFDGKLPPPVIRFELVPYGRGVAFFSEGYLKNRYAIILTPMLAGVSFLGPGSLLKNKRQTVYMRDVLLHEMVHASVSRMPAKMRGASHSSAGWCAEIQRIGTLLGFKNWEVGEYKTRRQSKMAGGKTYKGTAPGCATHAEMYLFPHATWLSIDPARYGGIELGEM